MVSIVMGAWEEVFVQCVSESGSVCEEALEKASFLMNHDAVEAASVRMAGLLMAVRQSQSAWVHVLRTHTTDFNEGISAYERVMTVMEPYMLFLLERKNAVFAFHEYLVPEHIDVALEHVWRAADAAIDCVGAPEFGLAHYTKRAVMSYAYGQTLLWWSRHQSADFCDLMSELHRSVQQGMRGGSAVKTYIRRFMVNGFNDQGEETIS